RWADLARGNAGQTQAFHVAPAVGRLFNRIDFAEIFHGEARLEAQQLVYIWLRLLAPAEMAERGDERLVAIDEFGERLDAAPADGCGTFVILGEKICDRIDDLEPGHVRVERRELAIMVQALQGRHRFADVTAGQAAQSPIEGQTGIDAQTAVEMINCRIKFLFVECAIMRINSERLGIFRVRLYCAQRKPGYLGKLLP